MLFNPDIMPEFGKKKTSDKVHKKAVMKHKDKPYTHSLQQKGKAKRVSAIDSIDFNQNKRRS